MSNYRYSHDASERTHSTILIDQKLINSGLAKAVNKEETVDVD